MVAGGGGGGAQGAVAPPPPHPHFPLSLFFFFACDFRSQSCASMIIIPLPNYNDFATTFSGLEKMWMCRSPLGHVHVAWFWDYLGLIVWTMSGKAVGLNKKKYYKYTITDCRHVRRGCQGAQSFSNIPLFVLMLLLLLLACLSETLIMCDDTPTPCLGNWLTFFEKNTSFGVPPPPPPFSGLVRHHGLGQIVKHLPWR